MNIYNGREIVGKAKSEKGALKVIRSTLSLSKKFNINVWTRSPLMCEILSQPPGFVFSVQYVY